MAARLWAGLPFFSQLIECLMPHPSTMRASYCSSSIKNYCCRNNGSTPNWISGCKLQAGLSGEISGSLHDVSGCNDSSPNIWTFWTTFAVVVVVFYQLPTQPQMRLIHVISNSLLYFVQRHFSHHLSLDCSPWKYYHFNPSRRKQSVFSCSSNTIWIAVFVIICKCLYGSNCAYLLSW